MILAILVHAFFFTCKIHLKNTEKEHPPQIRMVTMTLFQQKKKMPVRPSVTQPEKKNPIKQKPKPTHAKKPVLPSPEKPPAISEPEEPSEPAEKIQEEEPDVLPEAGKDMANVEAVNEATPLYKINPPPKYPAMAIRRGYSGQVLLRVLVDKRGQAMEIKIINSSGYDMLDSAAQKAVKNWAFEPGRKGDKKIDMWVNVPVVFRLEDT